MKEQPSMVGTPIELAKRLNSQNLQQAALMQLRKINPQELQRTLYDQQEGLPESIGPRNDQLYLLQLLVWGVQQPEVKEAVGLEKSSDLALTLEHLSQLDPRIQLLKLGLPSGRDEELEQELRQAQDSVDAVLAALNDWGNKIAER